MTLRVFSIIGSPHDGKSKTRALIEDFSNEISRNGVELENEIISLGRKVVNPCRGCWTCTFGKPCPIKDDLREIKQKMLGCDMLIIGSPVYLNQVSAQMKALFDRLFFWCHKYPLQGKYSLSAVTADNDGYKETAAFIEKMLAAYGTLSFGSITNIGACNPDFFPWRVNAKTHNHNLARKTARTILEGKKPATRKIQKEIFKIRI
jgi:multimeric flavodoxin WrbA